MFMSILLNRVLFWLCSVMVDNHTRRAYLFISQMTGNSLYMHNLFCIFSIQSPMSVYRYMHVCHRETAVWTCFRAKCGRTGSTRVSFHTKLVKHFYLCYSHLLFRLWFQAFAGEKSTYKRMNTMTKVKRPPRILTEESLGLEPLCDEVAIRYLFE